MNILYRSLFFVVLVLLAGCTVVQTPTEETSVAATAVSETQEATFTKEMLASYHTRTYYLRPGENLRSVAQWISKEIPYSNEIIVEVLVEINSGNIEYTNGVPGFVNRGVLDPIQIPDAPGIPSNLELGIQNPRELAMSHVVESGDTLYSLAPVYGFSHYTDFARAVGISNPDDYVLSVGEVLRWRVEEPAKFLGWPED